MKKLLLLLLCCVLLLTACAFASAEVSLTSINVGKADCHLLTLGEQVFDYVIRNKRKEWTEYRQQITRQELEQFLKVVPR